MYIGGGAIRRFEYHGVMKELQLGGLGSSVFVGFVLGLVFKNRVAGLQLYRIALYRAVDDWGSVTFTDFLASFGLAKM